jgi:negative regulator of flagellin synthesis FlgM
MTSPINHINRSTANALNNNANKTQEQTTANSPAQSPADTEDTVSISQETVHIRELQSQLNSISEVDQEKVEAIKQEIAKGNYPIDNEKIAENLINLEKALTE